MHHRTLLKPDGRALQVYARTPLPEANAGSFVYAALLGTKGEDYVRRLVAQSKYLETRSQATEWVAQGRYPLGIGIDDDIVEELQAKGIGKSLELLGRMNRDYLESNPGDGTLAARLRSY